MLIAGPGSREDGVQGCPDVAFDPEDACGLLEAAGFDQLTRLVPSNIRNWI